MKTGKAIDQTQVRAILDAVRESGRSARSISMAAVGHAGALRNLKRGQDLRVFTLGALCRELGLEFYVGPPRVAGGMSNGTAPPATAVTFGCPAPGSLCSIDFSIESGGSKYLASLFLLPGCWWLSAMDEDDLDFDVDPVRIGPVLCPHVMPGALRSLRRAIAEAGGAAQ